MGRPKGAKNKPKGAPKRPLRGRDLNPLGRGIPKNTQQIQNISLKDGILRAYEGMGGWRELMAWGKANPHDFYTKVLVKLIALELDVRKVDPVIVEVSLHDSGPLVLDNDTGEVVVPQNAALYPAYPGVVSRD